MNVGELVDKLSEYSPDTAVCVAVEDEDGRCQPVDVVTVERVLSDGPAYVNVVGEL